MSSNSPPPVGTAATEEARQQAEAERKATDKALWQERSKRWAAGKLNIKNLVNDPGFLGLTRSDHEGNFHVRTESDKKILLSAVGAAGHWAPLSVENLNKALEILDKIPRVVESKYPGAKDYINELLSSFSGNSMLGSVPLAAPGTEGTPAPVGAAPGTTAGTAEGAAVTAVTAPGVAVTPAPGTEGTAAVTPTVTPTAGTAEGAAAVPPVTVTGAAPVGAKAAASPPVSTPAYGMDYQKKLAAEATKVIINANRDNDYGFDISPDTKYSPYRGKDCNKDVKKDLEKLQCAKKKYTSKVGMKMHQKARKNKYIGLITEICKKDKQLACSKYALPIHDICNCDMNSMNLTDIVPYAMSFYRELGNLIESQTMNRDDYRELVRKGASKLDSVSDSMNEGRKKLSKVKDGVTFVAKGLAGDAKTVGRVVTKVANKITAKKTNDAPAAPAGVQVEQVNKVHMPLKQRKQPP